MLPLLQIAELPLLEQQLFMVGLQLDGQRRVATLQLPVLEFEPLSHGLSLDDFELHLPDMLQ